MVQQLPTIASAFLASIVEAVEALTIVLAVGASRGWSNALAGTLAALVLLVAIAVLLGPTLASLPRDFIQLVVGTFLLLFGLRWLRKAVLRRAGVIPLHDENSAYDAELRRLSSQGDPTRFGWDAAGLVAAFQITLVEGVEVVFIVIAIGAGRSDLLLWASLGAAAAVVLVAIFGLALHRPLARVPENTLKFLVGVLLCAFGVFWIGEGSGLAWPGGDWSLAGLSAGFLIAALLATQLSRSDTHLAAISGEIG